MLGELAEELHDLRRPTIKDFEQQAAGRVRSSLCAFVCVYYVRL